VYVHRHFNCQLSFNDVYYFKDNSHNEYDYSHEPNSLIVELISIVDIVVSFNHTLVGLKNLIGHYVEVVAILTNYYTCVIDNIVDLDLGRVPLNLV
jgi:hypothetical protein